MASIANCYQRVSKIFELCPNLAGWWQSHHHRSVESWICRLYTSWWFGTFFIFHHIWDNPSHWRTHIFSRWFKPPTSIFEISNVAGFYPHCRSFVAIDIPISQRYLAICCWCFCLSLKNNAKTHNSLTHKLPPKIYGLPFGNQTLQWKINHLYIYIYR